jgi:hypothetical protein
MEGQNVAFGEPGVPSSWKNNISIYACNFIYLMRIINNLTLPYYMKKEEHQPSCIFTNVIQE